MTFHKITYMYSTCLSSRGIERLPSLRIVLLEVNNFTHCGRLVRN